MHAKLWKMAESKDMDADALRKWIIEKHNLEHYEQSQLEGLNKPLRQLLDRVEAIVNTDHNVRVMGGQVNVLEHKSSSSRESSP